MKLRIAAFLAILALCMAGAASASQFKVSETRVQFGNMEEGPEAEKTINLTNVSGEPAVIANVSTSCACTTTRLDKTRLAPGDTASMVITYHTFKYPGKFDKTVHVFSGPDGKTEDVIHILGYVKPIPMGVMEVTPRKTQLGVLTSGKPNPVKVVVANAGDAAMTVTSVESRKFNTVYWAGKLTVEPGQSASVAFAVRPDKPGLFMDIIMIHSDARNDIGDGYKAVLIGDTK